MSSQMSEVIEDHISSHVVESVKGSERTRKARELIDAVQANLK
jgi:DNA-binding FrmR family transcriptional regulator